MRPAFVEHLLTYLDPGALRPLRVLVNPGNGGAGPVIDMLEPHLPLQFVKINERPDGTFPLGVPNPLLPENQAATSRAVREAGADVGIAWDGDFDRCFFFDEKGEFVDGYYLVGLLAQRALKRHPGANIIHDPRLVWNTEELVRQAGGTPVLCKSGHAFIKEKMRVVDAAYGGEMSAHHYFREFSYCDSGMIPWLQVVEAICESGRPLSEMLAERIARFPVSGEINLTLSDPGRAMEAVARALCGRLPGSGRDGRPEYRISVVALQCPHVQHRAGGQAERRDPCRQRPAAEEDRRVDCRAGVRPVRIALAQVNPTVGALEANAALVIEWMRAAEAAGADVVAFPELVISGYPPEDLLLKDYFRAGCWSALLEVAAENSGICALVGVPVAQGTAIYNSAAIVAGGRVAGAYRKICLPNYAVFDEKRYFTPGDRTGVLDVGGTRIGVNICEDIWEPRGPTVVAAREGHAGLVINLSMSPYHVGKGKQREAMLAQRARDSGAYVCYVNGVGGQDELVFDGQSLVFGPDGELIARARQFEEQLLFVDLDVQPPRSSARAGPGAAPEASSGSGDCDCESEPPRWGIEIITVEKPAQAAEPVGAGASIAECLSVEAEIYAALCLGARDYVRKNRFEQVVMGISGGIDSALTACIAADALGKRQGQRRFHALSLLEHGNEG